MNSPKDEALLLKVSTGKASSYNSYNSYKRILSNKHGLIRFMIKSILFLSGLTIFGIFLIYTYETIMTPKYNSILYDSNYVCHDSKTCGIKYHGNNYNFTHNNKNNNNNNNNNNNDKDNSTTTVAFFSSLYSDNYLKGALLLGYTIKKHHPNHKMYLQYFPGRLSINTICQARSIGWIMKPVKRIPPPVKVYKGYRDQYTKLRMWSFTEFKDGIIYLDSDTIVLKYIANLFELIKPSTGFEFAASPDLLEGKDSNTFNAGFMLLKPNIDVYNELMRTHNNTSDYEKGYAEQGFLNEFYRYRYLRLPETYNINISLMKTIPHLWKVLLPDMNVVHYTSKKPFSNSDPGIFAEPYELWIDLYNEMDKNFNLEKLASECEIDGFK